ncbi:hypothetical protein PKHYL_17080 [Psychrobacter sp. KH172YL61]|nr:hypothetical protein PKHYL_17080 [Psychrobacter sp. KH172YL61]
MAKGKDDSINTDTNPYNGDTIVEIQQATKDQLDEAYDAADQAQAKWAKRRQLSVQLLCIR